MIYIDEEHENKFNELMSKMKCKDNYHTAFAYLITMDYGCRCHISQIFDIEDDSIKDCFDKSWMTGGSRRSVTLAFALWNSFYKADINDIFNYSNEYNPYYVQAIQLRFH